LKAFWKRKQPVPVNGPTKWIVCCNVDGSGLRVKIVKNPAEVPLEVLYDTEQEAWEATLAMAMIDRDVVWSAFKKSLHEIHRIESKLKSLATGDTS